MKKNDYSVAIVQINHKCEDCGKVILKGSYAKYPLVGKRRYSHFPNCSKKDKGE
jgi:hypothetical protein